MDSRVLTVVLRKLGTKLDRLERLVGDLHEQLVAVDVKLDALLLDTDCDDSEESEEGESSESIATSSSASEESDDSDMTFVVDDHVSSADDTSDDPVPIAYSSASSSS
jgi:hypothetical protein